jgi:hypothetical protein
LKPGSHLNAVVCPPQRRSLVAVWVLLALFLGSTVAEARPRKKRNRRKPAATKPVKKPDAKAARPDARTPADDDTRPDPPAPASGAPAPGPAPRPAPGGDGKTKVFDFTGLDISGRLRAPQLLYFLERANEELERASLERRSFIPEMMRTLEEDQL